MVITKIWRIKKIIGSGIIGISRQKEFVLKWNLVKDEKLKQAQFIDDICDVSE